MTSHLDPVELALSHGKDSGKGGSSLKGSADSKGYFKGKVAAEGKMGKGWKGKGLPGKSTSASEAEGKAGPKGKGKDGGKCGEKGKGKYSEKGKGKDGGNGKGKDGEKGKGKDGDNGKGKDGEKGKGKDGDNGKGKDGEKGKGKDGKGSELAKGKDVSWKGKTWKGKFQKGEAGKGSDAKGQTKGPVSITEHGKGGAEKIETPKDVIHEASKDVLGKDGKGKGTGKMDEVEDPPKDSKDPGFWSLSFFTASINSTSRKTRKGKCLNVSFVSHSLSQIISW